MVSAVADERVARQWAGLPLNPCNSLDKQNQPISGALQIVVLPMAHSIIAAMAQTQDHGGHNLAMVNAGKRLIKMKTLYNKTNCLRMQNFDFRFNSSFRFLHFSFRLSLRRAYLLWHFCQLQN